MFVRKPKGTELKTPGPRQDPEPSVYSDQASEYEDQVEQDPRAYPQTNVQREGEAHKPHGQATNNQARAPPNPQHYPPHDPIAQAQAPSDPQHYPQHNPIAQAQTTRSSQQNGERIDCQDHGAVCANQPSINDPQPPSSQPIHERQHERQHLKNSKFHAGLQQRKAESKAGRPKAPSQAKSTVSRETRRSSRSKGPHPDQRRQELYEQFRKNEAIHERPEQTFAEASRPQTRAASQAGNIASQATHKTSQSAGHYMLSNRQNMQPQQQPPMQNFNIQPTIPQQPDPGRGDQNDYAISHDEEDLYNIAEGLLSVSSYDDMSQYEPQ